MKVSKIELLRIVYTKKEYNLLLAILELHSKNNHLSIMEKEFIKKHSEVTNAKSK